jgi:SAM-dependent methyltransferase
VTFLDQILAPRLRDYWKRLALRRVHYADRTDKLDRLYRVEDPWHMGSAKEQARFDWTNRLISTHLAPADTILEIGCGEGHQSQYLSRICGQLYGIDVSARAVSRARRRCPAGQFVVGSPFTFHLPNMLPPVDLVVACEVLYYVKDVPRFLTRISELGQACLVTYYQGQAEALDPHFAALPARSREQFRCDDTEWNAVWWHNRSWQ